MMVKKILKLLIMYWVFGLKKWLCCNFCKLKVIEKVFIIRINEKSVVFEVDLFCIFCSVLLLFCSENVLKIWIK